MNLFGHSLADPPHQKNVRPMMATNESVEVIRSLALELKYSEEITMFMLTLLVVMVELRDCKVRMVLVLLIVLMKLEETVMGMFSRAVT